MVAFPLPDFTILDFIGNKPVTVTLDDFQLDYLQEK
jgi:hypothetical protein